MLLCPLHKPCRAHIPLPFMPFVTAHTELHPSQGEVPQHLSFVHQCPHYAMQDTQRCYLQGAVIAGTWEMSSTPEPITFGLSNDDHACLFAGFLHLVGRMVHFGFRAYPDSKLQQMSQQWWCHILDT